MESPAADAESWGEGGPRRSTAPSGTTPSLGANGFQPQIGPKGGGISPPRGVVELRTSFSLVHDSESRADLARRQQRLPEIVRRGMFG